MFHCHITEGFTEIFHDLSWLESDLPENGAPSISRHSHHFPDQAATILGFKIPFRILKLTQQNVGILELNQPVFFGGFDQQE